MQPAGSEGGYYQDIAAFAIRCKEKPQLFKPEKIEYTEAVSTAKGYYLAAKPASIIYSFHKPVTVRSMRVVPNGNNIQSQRLLVQASDDGINFRDIKQLVPPVRVGRTRCVIIPSVCRLPPPAISDSHGRQKVQSREQKTWMQLNGNRC